MTDDSLAKLARDMRDDARRFDGCDDPQMLEFADRLDALAAQQVPESDSGCVCKGNWRSILAKCQSQIGKRFTDHKGRRCVFFGLVHGDDDYYYGMYEIKGMRLHLLSCVGSIVGHGYELSVAAEIAKGVK